MSRLYSSLRLVHPVDKLRSGSLPHLVSAAGNRTIEFRAEPYPHFAVMPENVEIPLVNVASAIPVVSRLSNKLTRVTGAKKPKREPEPEAADAE